MNISNIWKYDLRRSSTDHPANGACLFDAGMWLVYGRIGDNPPCSCPIIRRYAIGLNDMMPDDQRQRLKPFILRVVGNRDPGAGLSRLHVIVLETVRRIVPMALDRQYPALAAKLRALPDDAHYAVVRKLLGSSAAINNVAISKVVYATYTAVVTASSATAANVYTPATVWAAAIASVAAAVGETWDEAIAILDAALRIGKQSPEFDEIEVRASVAAFERARLLKA